MNNLDYQQPWYKSIIVIIIAFICFWPVGCVLLYLRWVSKDGKFKAINNVLLVCTILLLFIGFAGVIAFTESHDSSDLLLALLMFILPGGICGFFWYQRRNKIKGYNQYLAYIRARKKVKIDTLCNKLNVDYDTAVNALTDMINKGMIKGYLEDDELIIKYTNNDANNLMEERITERKETKIVKCKECGAKNNIIVGEKNECEYCGSLLQ